MLATRTGENELYHPCSSGRNSSDPARKKQECFSNATCRVSTDARWTYARYVINEGTGNYLGNERTSRVMRRVRETRVYIYVYEMTNARKRGGDL